MHHLLAGRKARGEIRDQYYHAIDIVPTILDLLGVEAPETIKGHTQSPRWRQHARAASTTRRPRPPKDAVLRDARLALDLAEGWKAVTTHPTLAGWGHFNDDEWELYHADVDRAEVHNSRPSSRRRFASW